MSWKDLFIKAGQEVLADAKTDAAAFLKSVADDKKEMAIRTFRSIAESQAEIALLRLQPEGQARNADIARLTQTIEHNINTLVNMAAEGQINGRMAVRDFLAKVAERAAALLGRLADKII